jgi:Recombination endonuclease VII
MGRRPTLEVELGGQFGRLVVDEIGQYQGKRGALVHCTGSHDPVSKWVNLAALARGAVQSCGCLNRELAADRARERNAAVGGSVRAGTGKRGLPAGVRYVKKDKPYGSLINDEGRECTYKGEGNCGQQFKAWAEFNKGNGARGCVSWCRGCQRAHHLATDPELLQQQALVRRLKVFGLAVEQYRALEAVHGGRCWLCGEFEAVTKAGGIPRLGVDHDHSCCNFEPTARRPLCGKCIRGLCCHRCNRQVLGNVESVGADKVFTYLASAQATAQALLGVPGA